MFMISQHSEISMRPGPCVNSHRTAGPPGLHSSPLRAHAHTWNAWVSAWMAEQQPHLRKNGDWRKKDSTVTVILETPYLTLSKTIRYTGYFFLKLNPKQNKPWARNLWQSVLSRPQGPIFLPLCTLVVAPFIFKMWILTEGWCEC